MNAKIRFLIALLALDVCSVTMQQRLFAQPQRLGFERLSPGKGMSTASIYTIFQDKQGLMWFGGPDGLFSYDGYKFKPYKHDTKDPYTISEHWVTSITEDHDRNLWIGVWEGGLNYYDRAEDKFYSYVNDPGDSASLSNNTVWKVYIDRFRKIWVGTRGGGVNRFDPVTKKFERFTTHSADATTISDDNISAIYEDSYGNLWIGTLYKGLNRYNREKNSFERFKHQPDNPNSIPSDAINEIWEDSGRNLWIGTSDQGLSILSPDRKHFQHFKPEKAWGKLSNKNIRSFYEDKNKTVWVGTDGGGINLYDPRKKVFTQILNDPRDPASISSNVAFAIYKSRDGIVWVGGYLSGLSVYDNNKDKFQSFSKINRDGTGLSNYSINAVHDDARGYFWIGTDEGLNRYDPGSSTFKYYLHDASDRTSISGDNIKSVYEDVHENLWIGTIGSGLNLYLRDKDQFVKFQHNPSDPHSLTHDNVWVTLEDSKGRFWVATYGGGLNLLDRGKKTFRPFWLKDSLNKLCPEIFSVTEDKIKGGLWIGSTTGLCYYNSEKQQLKIYRHKKGDPSSLSSDEAVVVHQDSENNTWIGTGTGEGGLDLYHPESGSFTSFKIGTDFRNNTITGIVEDDNHNLWVSTFRGISRFNTKTRLWVNYSIEDGLQSTQFVKGSSFKRKNGTIIFGSIDGITIIHPDQFENNHFVPNVVINKLLILNKEVNPGDKDSILKKVISETREISLTYSEYVVTFEFTALSYSNPEQNEYAYKLTNFEKDWNYIGTKRSATYTNLDPGEYTFTVKASNGDGVWNEKGVSIKLIITPPFWLTWWFKFLLVSVIIGAFVVFVLLRDLAIKAQRLALEHEVKERTEQLAHSMAEERKARMEAEKAYQEAELATQAKSIFLATMSHEIRTPMNGVVGMSSMLAETALTDEQRMYTETITSCGESLLNVINDILDFSKVESGKMELENEAFDLRSCIEDILGIFGGRAAEAGLDLVYRIDEGVPLEIIGDHLRLRQILTNLVGNALKFTTEGEVAVMVYLLESGHGNPLELAFEVRDTGIGIPAEKLERLFKAFSQVDSSTTRKYGGTGLGLAISEKLVKLMNGKIDVKSHPGIGSTFTFTIKTYAGNNEDKIYSKYNMATQEGKRILVVDDNPTNLAMVKGLLEQWGLRPVPASSAAAALNLLAENPCFDLVITDMKMPDMNGLELAKVIRSRDAYVPIMLLHQAGDASIEDNPLLFRSALNKPIRHQELGKQIMSALQGTIKLAHEEKTLRPNLSPGFSAEFPLDILIAEDNVINQKVILHILDKMGYKPELAENGREAVEAVRGVHYDLILMDMQMPEMDGLEATRVIRQMMQDQPVIIALTANTIQGDREECLQAGMNDFISKPIKLDELMNKLRKWSRYTAGKMDPIAW